MISRPILLTCDHDTALFNCGHDTLNDWLKKRALKNQDNGASRSFVVCESHRVIGYYALASGSVERLVAPGAIARNMPEPIPIVVLGRLAVDLKYQGQKLGAALLKDAMQRTLSIAQHVGIRAMLVHAISEQAKQFYQAYDFQETRVDPMIILISIERLKRHY
ncbi:MAG: GNAT family N-acetyltransferase [Methylococcaceae bacterium]